MTSNVEGQRDCDSDHSGDAFQTVIDIVAGVSVGASLVEAGITDDGQQIVALVFGVLVENHLHLLCPLDDKLLAGLAPAVDYITVFEIGFLQKSHVDKAHPPEVKAHKKHIAGVVLRRCERQVQRFYFLYGKQRQSPLYGLVNAGIDMPERIAVFDNLFFHRAVIYRPQDSGVERYGI